ncbi:acyl-CoA thioesterase [Chelativorans sp. YIM 93263]|uniref:acyl-CoA thioesterase n=1 Tax=Chelativorans sp. YIM 93263 TaxID=2906648 RepID=UPI0023785470|nr:thioesterase family protein [Chelativorans sp. YIM 93263]
MARRSPSSRSAFDTFVTITPRWNDIDVFGHVNNAEFYAWFDTAVLTVLHRLDAVAAEGSAHAALVVESGAQFFAPVLFTDTVEVGLSVDRIGTSSVTYKLGVFANQDDTAAVEGGFTHVFVDRATRRPVPIPQTVRSAFETLMPEKASQ